MVFGSLSFVVLVFGWVQWGGTPETSRVNGVQTAPKPSNNKRTKILTPHRLPTPWFQVRQTCHNQKSQKSNSTRPKTSNKRYDSRPMGPASKKNHKNLNPPNPTNKSTSYPSPFASTENEGLKPKRKAKRRSDAATRRGEIRSPHAGLDPGLSEAQRPGEEELERVGELGVGDGGRKQEFLK